MLRRTLLAAAAAILTTLAPVAAQDFPTKPITLVVPFAPGGSSDVIARLVAQKLSDLWKHQVIVDNKAGGGGQIAMQHVARSAPDGYTLVLGHIGTLAFNPAMYDKLSYDAKKEFKPVAMLSIVASMIAAHPSAPFKDLKGFIEAAKAKPDEITYGTAGNGSAGHLAMEYFKDVAGIKVQHVPYKGTGPMMNDLLGGQTMMTFTGAIPLAPHIKSGKLRPIAIGSTKRLTALPDVPTIAELGYAGFETSQWYGIIAPAATPAAIIKKLNEDINKVLAMPDVVKRLEDDGALPGSGSPEEFGKYIDAEAARWSVVVKKAGVKPD